MPVPIQWEDGDKLFSPDLNLNFEWLCNQLVNQPELIEALASRVAELEACKQDHEARINALENP